jgi:prepilin-type N-terminal cleavage/methylation domain-containing protein
MKKPVSIRTGFSLAEVMIALGLFGIMATAFVGSTMFARKSAESAIAENAALNLAQSYMEQLKSFSFSTLMASANDATIPLPTMTNATTTDYIYENAYTTKTLVIRTDDSGNTAQTLDVSIMPAISNAQGGDTSWSIIGIEVFYRWTDPVTNSIRTASIRSAKSNL